MASQVPQNKTVIVCIPKPRDFSEGITEQPVRLSCAGSDFKISFMVNQSGKVTQPTTVDQSHAHFIGAAEAYGFQGAITLAAEQ